MKVFISWSGEIGKTLAQILSTWLPKVIQAVKPFFSPDDIAKGARWSSEVGSELEASQVGIIVVTRDSASAPWIMFEAGALSKNVGRARVVPILFDLDPTDISGPLMQFQCAKIGEVEIKRLLRMLNSELRNLSLTDDALESAFAMWWPSLEKELSRVSRQQVKNAPANQRTERQILEEILGLAKSIAQHQSEEPKLREAKEFSEKWSGAFTIESIKERIRSGGNLAGANLMNLDLTLIDLSATNLRGASLVGTNLSGVNW
jgi:hypothetical protein